ncbi:MAG: GNAT family N-acetyltransferase [Schwartzia sp. (in: firmicutes)]
MAVFRVTREETEDGGIYRAWDAEGTLAGYMTWQQLPSGERSLDHTKVEEAFSGQGVGLRLLEEAMAEAREEKMRLRPVCSFVAHYFDKHGDEVADIRGGDL